MIQKIVTRIEAPEEWESTNDWDSHRELLYLALQNTADVVMEIGSGMGSTPLISKMCSFQSRRFESFETDKKYYDVVHESIRDTTEYILCNDYTERVKYKFPRIIKAMLLFVDCAPGEIRKDFISDYADKINVIVTHDTEPGANYVYQMADVLSTFKYRLDYQPEGKPHTTAVSNFIDVTKWV